MLDRSRTKVEEDHGVMEGGVTEMTLPERTLVKHYRQMAAKDRIYLHRLAEALARTPKGTLGN